MHLLSKTYWAEAYKNFRNTKVLILCSMLIALHIAISTFYIQVFENLRIYVTFFISATYALVGGPLLALACGFSVDMLGMLIHPSGAFFFGYTLSTMLTGLIYALFFYKTRITLMKIILAKSIVNIFINAILGSVWTTMLFSNGFIYYVSASLTKNLILLPLEIIVLYLVFKAILPMLYRLKLVNSSKISIR